jgi:hypothetical protein
MRQDSGGGRGGIIGWAQARKKPLLTLAGVLLLAWVAFAYYARSFSLLRGPLMILWRHPALFTIPFIFSLFGLAVHVGIKTLFGDGYKARDTEQDDHFTYRRERLRFPGTALTWAASGLVGLLVPIIFTGPWTDVALYSHTTYGKLTPSMLEGARVRVKPFDVAVKQMEASLNSPTDNLNDYNLVKVGGKLWWTAVRVPNGSIRSFSYGSDGIIMDSAEQSQPKIVVNTPQTSGTFDWSPGAKLGINFGWHAHEDCYTCDITEVIGAPTPSGPILYAPFVKWEGGLFINHPVFGGVFVEDTHGSFKMLSASQAEADPQLVALGNIYPESLALRIASAYAYKYGNANKLWTHKGQFDVDEEVSEGNTQPYLEDFKGLGMQWVTTLKPNGETYTTGAIITTSAINGQTRIWLTNPKEPLIDSRKAIEIVRGEPISGVTFANPGAEDSGGKYFAIEPRQVFPPGWGLQFLVTIVPSEETRISLSEVVDASTQQVVGAFQADAQGDADLIRYLSTGILPASERYIGDGAGIQTGLTSTPLQEGKGTSTTPTKEAASSLPASASTVATLERLLRENESNQASFHAEQSYLERLLKTAKATQH